MDKDNALKLLRRGRQRIIEGWCKNALSLDSDNWGCMSDDPRAAKWCALGAVYHPSYDGACALLRTMKTVPGLARYGEDVAAFNNDPTTTREDILSLFDRAIASVAPAQRPTSALVADLVATLGKQTIPEGEIASPEYVS